MPRLLAEPVGRGRRHDGEVGHPVESVPRSRAPPRRIREYEPLARGLAGEVRPDAPNRRPGATSKTGGCSAAIFISCASRRQQFAAGLLLEGSFQCRDRVVEASGDDVADARLERQLRALARLADQLRRRADVLGGGGLAKGRLRYGQAHEHGRGGRAARVRTARAAGSRSRGRRAASVRSPRGLQQHSTVARAPAASQASRCVAMASRSPSSCASVRAARACSSVRRPAGDRRRAPCARAGGQAAADGPGGCSAGRGEQPAEAAPAATTSRSAHAAAWRTSASAPSTATAQARPRPRRQSSQACQDGADDAFRRERADLRRRRSDRRDALGAHGGRAARTARKRIPPVAWWQARRIRRRRRARNRARSTSALRPRSASAGADGRRALLLPTPSDGVDHPFGLAASTTVTGSSATRRAMNNSHCSDGSSAQCASSTTRTKRLPRGHSGTQPVQRVYAGAPPNSPSAAPAITTSAGGSMTSKREPGRAGEHLGALVPGRRAR